MLPIGYFANVIEMDGIGLALCTDGVGSKTIIADMMGKYDTIGIDCVAMNVNDMICVGAKPLSLVDYIAVERADAAMLDAIGAGLCEGARQAGISISGGETSQLKDIVQGLRSRRHGGRPRRPRQGDRRPGTCAPATSSSACAATACTATGYSLARRAFFADGPPHRRPQVRRARRTDRRGAAAADPHLRSGGDGDPGEGRRRQGADQHHQRRPLQPDARRRRRRLRDRPPDRAAADLRR